MLYAYYILHKNVVKILTCDYLNGEIVDHFGNESSRLLIIFQQE